ncbi:F0F1 ATP synthase subunit gamma [Roseomonas sp. E05]|uniref:F0F1 ATP synthase subunit gamma n=1 Tax=Roseomonas sp. E05 TaxID=3046310 RepID=UPI0024B89E3E|nr:F0F1 ATP synthase subunit gamma [Roseomonas sp. E05]MDJ0390508.1 F0F1 ATP synthase subunit gamma [Roseomonas sp. E05]
MTGQLAEISARLGTVKQLDAVVGAMRGMAAARAQQGRNLLPAIRTYAGVVAQALAQALQLLPAGLAAAPVAPGQRGLIVFCAEQGFAGAFTERVLDMLLREGGDSELFLIGSRGAARAAEHGLHPGWTAAMPPHVDGLAGLANRLGDALYTAIHTRALTRIEMLLPDWNPQQGLQVARRPLLPLDPGRFATPHSRNPPLVNLPPAQLVEGLAEEYVHAQLREAVTIAFAAENEARMTMLTAARGNIGRMLEELGMQERQVRQESITAEVVELAGGSRAVAARG